MPQTLKIATCCYCGTRAALVLDKGRHALSCAGCGAPLTNLKRMPQPAKAVKSDSSSRARPAAKRSPDPALPRRKPRKAQRRPKRRWGREIFEEIWDVVEDVFD